MKKIAILSMSYFPSIGGLQTVTNKLAIQYSKHNFEVHIITGTTTQDTSNDTVKNIHIHRKHLFIKNCEYSSFIVKSLSHIVYNIRAFIILAKLKPEYIHCQTPYPSLSAWLIFKLLKIPYSIGYHAEIKTHVGIMLTPSLSRYWKKLPYITGAHNRFVLTDSMKRDLEMEGISSTVIPNGVDTDIYHPTPNNKTTFKTKPTIICVGRLVESKAFDDAIHIVSRISEKYPEIRLIIVGDGPERDNLERLVETLNLQERVSLVGNVEPNSVCSYYQKSHVFLQTSITEGFPMVVLEAMACGLPIVSTNVANTPELISKADNGYITDFHDIDSAADMIDHILMMSENEYNGICNRSRTCALEYSWDMVSNMYLDAYNLEQN